MPQAGCPREDKSYVPVSSALLSDWPVAAGRAPQLKTQSRNAAEAKKSSPPGKGGL